MSNYFCPGAVNITYDVIRGSLQDLSQVEGALAEPGQDFISGTGSVILQDRQTSVTIPVTILEVKTLAVNYSFTYLSITLDDYNDIITLWQDKSFHCASSCRFFLQRNKVHQCYLWVCSVISASNELLFSL